MYSCIIIVFVGKEKLLVIYIMYNIDMLYTHRHSHSIIAQPSLSSWAFISPTPIMSPLCPSCHPWAAAEWQRSSTQWRLIYQKCQQHLLLSPPVTAVTSGGGGPRSTSVLSPELGHSRLVPIGASQCQFELVGSYSMIGDCFPKWPLFTYGALGGRHWCCQTLPWKSVPIKRNKCAYESSFWYCGEIVFFKVFFPSAAVKGASGGLWPVFKLQRVSWFWRSPLRLVCPPQYVRKCFCFQALSTTKSLFQTPKCSLHTQKYISIHACLGLQFLAC